VVNLKISVFIAIIAFVLSFLIGLVSRTSMPMAVIRPFIFAVIFFLITAAIQSLVERFLPELLDKDISGPDTDFLPGSKVNITVGEPQSYSQAIPEGTVPAVPKPLSGSDNDEELGNINELLQRKPGSMNIGQDAGEGMDQDAIDGYTGTGSMEDFSFPQTGDVNGQAESAADSKGEGPADSSPVEVLPDLDSMAGVFFPAPGTGESETPDYSVPSSARQPSSRKKAPEWTEDFNAKEIAMGLRTVLNKEKEG